MNDADWRPSADAAMLRFRAETFESIRRFFRLRNVLEVETACIERFPANEVGLDSFTVNGRYLRTSHEAAMKRLLAAGSGDVYQLGKAFRSDESGTWHNPEFTLLEWYRKGWSYKMLMEEVETLLHDLFTPHKKLSNTCFVSCAELLRSTFDIDLSSGSAAALPAAARARGFDAGNDGTAAFDFLIDSAAREQFSDGCLTFVYDYPEERALLAKVRGGIAERFETYIGGLELANGYTELTDASVCRRRFERENALRREAGKVQLPVNTSLLGALEHGMPECAGVSVGVDRLLAVMAGRRELSATLPFDWERA